MTQRTLVESNELRTAGPKTTDHSVGRVAVQGQSRIEAQAILPEGCTIGDMGSFYSPCVLVNPVDRARSINVPKLLVDTGSESTWIPSQVLKDLGIGRERIETYVMANGQPLTRGIGYSIIRIGNYFTIDEVVFGEPGDMSILGAHTLEGLNLTIDWQRKQLISAGPRPVAHTR